MWRGLSLVVITLIGAALLALTLQHRTYRANLRLLRACWQAVQLLRKHAPLIDVPSSTTIRVRANDTADSKNDHGKNNDGEVKNQWPRDVAMFQKFCDYWREYRSLGTLTTYVPSREAREEESRLWRLVDRVPLQYSKYARLADLRARWGRFVWNACTGYRARLDCSNGLVFDWSRETVGMRRCNGANNDVSKELSAAAATAAAAASENAVHL